MTLLRLLRTTGIFHRFPKIAKPWDEGRNLMIASSSRRLLCVGSNLQKSLGWNAKRGLLVLASSDWKNSKNKNISNRGDGEYRKRFFSSATHSLGNKVEFFGTWRNFCTNSPGFRVSQDITEGIAKGNPIVALESAIITHGMPFPQNIDTALRLQNIIRKQGAIPATVGVIRGQLTVGLSDEEIERLGRAANSEKVFSKNSTPVIKVSRRDLPYALSQKVDGGTTVSGTIVAAVKAGIPIFATGGIGGVHRGAETTFDISADLRELGRSPIAVISAGVKSILDIGKTLEYLETEGVCVVVLKRKKEGSKGDKTPERNNDHDDDHSCDDHQHRNETGEDKLGKSGQIGKVKFPSFFTAESQFAAPYSLTDELQAAHLVNSSINFGLHSGILIAVPIPKEHEAAGHKIEEAIVKALGKAEKMGIEGRDMTPFLLGEINRLTSGDSLAANKYLIENNVQVATQIAILLAKLRRTGSQPLAAHSSSLSPPTQPQTPQPGRSEHHERFIDSGKKPVEQVFCNPSDTSNISHVHQGFTSGVTNETITKAQSGNRRPVVIGGSSLDLILSVQEKEILADGRTHNTKIRTASGGVGRNVAEALGKLGHNPILISTIGNDLFGRELLKHFHETKMDTSHIFTLDGESPTAIYSALLNHQGECVFGLGDMSIHEKISDELILNKCKDAIRNASIVVMDANITVDAMTAVMKICTEAGVPVWFEPTEVRKAKKILQVPREYWAGLRYISPNLRELMSITEIDLNGDLSKDTSSSGTNNTFTFDLSQSQLQSLFSRCFSLFVALEVILFTRGKDGIWVISRGDDDGDCVLKTESHPPPELDERDVKSVSGAGDCLNAGFISGILQNMNLSQCAIRGTLCAKKSLQSINNVPEKFI